MTSFDRIGGTCTCKAGFTLMGTSCSPCELGKWKNESGVTSCSRCEVTLKGAITISLGSKNERSCICPVGYYDGGKGECVVVKEGMDTEVVGMKLESVFLDPGFWRTNEKSEEILECPIPDACTGGNDTDICREGHKGHYCATCKDGYSMDPFQICKECMTTVVDSVLTVVVVLSVVVLAFGLNYVMKKKFGREDKGKAMLKRCKNGIKILFTSGQITASLPTIIPAIALPKNFKEVIKASQVLNLNVFTFVPMGCFTEEFSYYTKALTLTAPIIVAVGGLIVMGLARKRSNFLTAAIAITYLTLPTITTTAFGLFPCESFDDETRMMRRDYDISCLADGRDVWVYYGYLIVGMFPVGVTLMYFLLLYRVRDKLKDEDRDNIEDLRGIVFLWEPYKRDFWWWEVFETARRLAMTGYLSTIEPGSFYQISVGSIMSLIYGMLLAWSRPFIEKRDNLVAVLSAVLLSMTFISAFLMKSQKMVEDGYEANNLGAILVALTIITISIFMVCAWHSINDLSESSRTEAAGVFKNNIGSFGSFGSFQSLRSLRNIGRGKSSSREGSEVRVRFALGSEMKEMRRGSEFRTENPMHPHKKEEEKRKKKKGFLSQLSDDLAKKSFDIEMKKKPANKEAQRMDEKERKEGVPGPPPGEPPVRKVFTYGK